MIASDTHKYCLIRNGAQAKESWWQLSMCMTAKTKPRHLYETLIDSLYLTAGVVLHPIHQRV